MHEPGWRERVGCETATGTLADQHVGLVCPECYSDLTETSLLLYENRPADRDWRLFERNQSTMSRLP
jgi:hypothetical protein